MHLRTYDDRGTYDDRFMQMCPRSQGPGKNVTYTYVYQKLYLLKCLNFDWPSPVAKKYVVDDLADSLHTAILGGSHHICACTTLFASLQHCSTVQPGKHQNLTYRHRCRPWRSLVALILNGAMFSRKRKQAARLFPSSLTTEPRIPSIHSKTITSRWFPSCQCRHPLKISHLRLVMVRRGCHRGRAGHHHHSICACL